ncbi:MAG: ABC transporter permease, partial [Muribaculaceae bacterium]|nr:ABC transporter permease [Muribaculaceae bacterium]
FAISILLYMLLFILALGVEVMIHFSDLSATFILKSLKEYFLNGLGVFLVVSPIIAWVSYMKKGYWLALIFTEIYSFTGLFASMSSTLRVYYPITAVFNFSGHYKGNVVVSALILLLCGGLACLLLIFLKYIKKD